MGSNGDYTDPYGATSLLECPGGREIYTLEMEYMYDKWFNFFES
jgi:hypothetical protein